MGVLERAGRMASASLPGRTVRRHLVGTRPLDAGTRGLSARDHGQRRVAGRPPPVHPAHRRGVATLRSGLRAVRHAQPRAAAELPERALAAVVAAAVRAGDLSLLSRTRRADGRAAAAAHARGGDQRALPRHRNRAVGSVAMGRVSAGALDGVTIDVYGTLVTLVDPVPALTAALAARDVERDRQAVAHAFRTEVAHYAQHSAEGHDDP